MLFLLFLLLLLLCAYFLCAMFSLNRLLLAIMMWVWISNANCVGLMPSRFAKLRIMPCLEGNIQWNTWLINFYKHVAPARQQEYRVVVQRLIREPSFALSFAHLGFDQQLKAVVDLAKSSYVGIGDVQAFFGNVIQPRLSPVPFTQFEDFFEKLDERADKNEGTVYQSILTEFFLVMWRLYCTDVSVFAV